MVFAIRPVFKFNLRLSFSKYSKKISTAIYMRVKTIPARRPAPINIPHISLSQRHDEHLPFEQFKRGKSTQNIKMNAKVALATLIKFV